MGIVLDSDSMHIERRSAFRRRLIVLTFFPLKRTTTKEDFKLINVLVALDSIDQFGSLCFYLNKRKLVAGDNTLRTTARDKKLNR